MDDGAIPGDELLERTRAALATGPVCDACLGRVVADRSHGLTNAERGRALRTAVALRDDVPVGELDAESTDGGGDTATETCWVCEGVCAAFEEWADAVVNRMDGIGFDTFQIGTRVPPLVEENERLLREDAGWGVERGEPINREVNREVGKRVWSRLDAARDGDVDVDHERPDVVATLDLKHEPAEGVEIRINPAFVYGRYRKLERDIPQTEWPCRECDGAGHVVRDGGTVECDHCDGVGKLYETSVEELVSPPIVRAMDGAQGTFHGAGREDVDARMLGDGRPFVVEVAEPRARTPDIDAVAADIAELAGDRVEVRDLRLASHHAPERVKEHEARKEYRALVRFEEAVSDEDLAAAVAALDGADVEQRTPNRVAHRRADLVRTRRVYDAAAELGADPDEWDAPALPDGVDVPATPEAADAGRARLATLRVETEGGCYVKELVSGDQGRSEPSLAGELGVASSVVALDVLAVIAEDGPFEDGTIALDGESAGSD
jgi:tRNA pseudouridine synthase 10